MESKHILLESFYPHGQRMVLDIGEDGLRINIDKYGMIQILKTEEKCHLCNGSGGIRYFYAQDESTGVACPICGGGNQANWNREKARYEEFIKNNNW